MSAILLALIIWIVTVSQLQSNHEFKQRMEVKERRGEKLSSEESERLLSIWRDEV